MKELELTGALDGLKIVDVADLARYKRAIADGEQMGFAYYFPGLLSYNRPGRCAVLLIEDEGSVCVFRWTAGNDKAKLDIHVAPAPMNTKVLQRCLERANDFNHDTGARVLKLDAKDADIVASLPELRVKARKSQYLYAPDAFADISGRRYRTVRRNVTKIQAMDKLEVLPFVTAHTEACLELLQKWRKHHRTTHGTMGGVGTSRRILELATKFELPDMHGEVMFIDDKLVSYGFGGEIRPGYAAFLEAKCDFDIQGLSFYQRYSFISRLKHYKLVNDGPDVGRAGLAQLKNSLRPVGMHTEYRAIQKQ
jgi:hypothetical protein